MMKVLVGCEISGIVRDAFLARGHDAWSCDLKPCEAVSNRHIVGDVLDVMQDEWDLLAVMHPPCTRLCNSGVRWLTKPPKGKTLDQMWRELEQGCGLFSAVWNVPHIPRVAVENPVMHRHAKERIENFKPASQSVQPWQFGTSEAGPDNERKRTCLWLRNLPNLKPTGTLDGSTARQSVAFSSPSSDRGQIRSRFFPGLAAAMADQWGNLAEETSKHAA
ncbi:MAG: hypothetical protein AAF727_06165 [Pseudomonadota bacterium]